MSKSAEAATAVDARPASRCVVLPMSTDGLGSAVNALAWPVILENVFQTALGTVSMLMVSRLGAAAIAGIGTATQLLFVVQAAFAAITTGITVLVAHFVGAKEPEQAHAVVKQALLLSGLLSLVFALPGLFLSEWLVQVLGAEPDVVVAGAAYLRITMTASFVMITMYTISGALRGAGDSRTPMLVTAGISVVNVVLSWILIFGKLGAPAMGIAGAAWAVTISRAIGTAVLFWSLLGDQSAITIRGRRGWKPDLPLTWRMLRIGLPTMAEQLLMSGGNLIFAVISISLGTTIYAAQRIAFQATNFTFVLGAGYAMAATAVVGQYLGAKRPDLSERANAHSVRMGTILMVAAGLLSAAFGRPLMRLFTDDAPMIAVGVEALWVINLAWPGMAVAQVLAGSLRGAGDTRFPMVITFLGIWGVRVPLSYLFGPMLGWGLSGLCLALAVDSLLRAIASWLRYRAGSWRDIEV